MTIGSTRIGGFPDECDDYRVNCARRSYFLEDSYAIGHEKELFYTETLRP